MSLHPSTLAAPHAEPPPRAAAAPCAIAPSFLARVLAPYQPTGTDYLRSAWVSRHSTQDAPGVDAADGLVSARGRYVIPGSCYIQSTGHFNAVEFLICFNQLAYVTFGHLVAEGRLASLPRGRVSDVCRQGLRALTVDRFFAHQLSSMFILKTETRFKRVIDPADFAGDLVVNAVFHRHGLLLTSTTARFHDAHGGEAEGDVLLAWPVDAH